MLQFQGTKNKAFKILSTYIYLRYIKIEFIYTKFRHKMKKNWKFEWLIYVKYGKHGMSTEIQ